jgi:hypothetical protein
MPRQTRRAFLKRTGAGVAAVTALPLARAAHGKSAGSPAESIPAHRAIDLAGVHAYASQESVLAGQTIHFHVSSTAPSRMSICRLGLKIDDPAGDIVLREFPETPATPQSIHPGSYVHVAKSITKLQRALTLECWVRPWTFGRWQDVMTQMSYPLACDLALALGPDATVTFYVGDGGKFRERWALSSPKGALQKGQWQHLVAIWDGVLRTLWVNGREVARTSEGPPSESMKWRNPLRLGCGGNEGKADDFFDGDLAMPIIYERVPSASEIEQRFSEQALVAARGKDILACWTLNEERGDRVADASRHGRHGRIINHGTWMIGGPSFQAEVPRFGNYDPRKDPRRGHALRFASDDLYDCRWNATHTWRVPRDTRPGLHAARLQFELNGKPHLYDVTFNVRRAPSRKKASIVLLCSSNTWRAYSGTPFAANNPTLKQVWGTGGGPELSNKPPAFNFYRAHAAGQGTYQVGLRMPWPAAGPYILYGGPTDYSHLMRADRFFHVWLEQAGYDFDVIMDSDLHRDPDLLREYRVLVINGHSEYWSSQMCDGLEGFLKRGGNTIVLSGNSLFWRVSFNDDCSIIECRKVDAPGDQLPPSRRGECWHSQDGHRGGMWRECGRPGWKLVGLETLGWNNQANPKNFGPYIAEATDHFLFNTPEQTSLRAGDRFGWRGADDKTPLANGHEFDIRLSTLAALQEQPAPANAVMPDDPSGIIRLANGIIPWKQGGSAFDYFFRAIKPRTDQGGEMIYWERADGGRVFNAGSIGAGWAVHADPKFQTLMRNVLAHFGVRQTG